MEDIGQENDHNMKRQKILEKKQDKEQINNLATLLEATI
jgi:hypothetical protein